MSFHAARVPGDSVAAVARPGRVVRARMAIRSDRRAGARGSALVVVLLALTLVSALALALSLLAMVDTLSASNERSAQVVLYAAEAGVERTIPELARLTDWDGVLSGTVLSGFVDGPPSGTRQLPDGHTADLAGVASLANCGKVSGCSTAQLQALTDDRPWGADNPVWRPFAYGPCGGPSPPAPAYLVVLVADDPSENDGDPFHDGLLPGNPGAGVILLRAEAFGAGGAHRVVEATVARSPDRAASGVGAATPRILRWKEVR